MAFWSGETLKLRLPKLVTGYDADRIDCNAYTLRVGEQYFVTPSDEDRDIRTRTRAELKPEQSFTIPPGQFALVLTEEEVTVPRDAMAFISMKATVKMNGIVNVSGFHVDPGYKGKLTFALFNAGPAIVRFHRGQSCFLIWYASLDHTTAIHKRGGAESGIPIRFVNNFSDRLVSLSGLSDRLDAIEEKFNERAHKIEKDHAYIKYASVAILSAIASVALALGVRWAWTQLEKEPAPAPKVGQVDASNDRGQLPAATPAQREQLLAVPGQQAPAEPVAPQNPSAKENAPPSRQ
jgi:dCTP deaminase